MSYLFWSMWFFFHIPYINETVSICLSLSDLFHLVECCQGPSHFWYCKMNFSTLHRVSQVALVKKKLPAKTHGFDLWAGKIPWRRKQQPTPVFLPGDAHGRGAWRATVHGVAKSQTQLKRLSMHHTTQSLNEYSMMALLGHSSLLTLW